jgi:hypothetical protein
VNYISITSYLFIHITRTKHEPRFHFIFQTSLRQRPDNLPFALPNTIHAAVGTTWSLLCLRQKGKSALCLFQKHLICLKYTQFLPMWSFSKRREKHFFGVIYAVCHDRKSSLLLPTPTHFILNLLHAMYRVYDVKNEKKNSLKLWCC